jgi:hypothetical protein
MMQMGPLYLPFEIVAAGAALLLLVIGVIAGRASRQRTARDDAARATFVSERGWQLEADHRGTEKIYRYSGTTDGVSWNVLSTYHSGSDAPHAAYTRLTTSAGALSGGVIEVWPNRGGGIQTGAQLNPDNFIVKTLLKPMMRALVDAADAPFLDTDRLLDVRPVDVSDRLAQHFMVLASDGVRVDGLLSADGEAALAQYAEWANSREGKRTPGAALTLILAWERGLTILTQGATLDPAVIERILALGCTLARQPTAQHM